MDAAGPESPSATSLVDAPWQLAYERTSLDGYLAAVDAERVRLLSAIAAAEARLAAAKERVADGEGAERAALDHVAATAQAEIARLDDEFRRAIDEVRSAAAREAADIVAAARDRSGPSSVGARAQGRPTSEGSFL